MSMEHGVAKKRQINTKVDQDFFTDVKVKAVKEDISLQELVEKLLKGWLEDNFKV